MRDFCGSMRPKAKDPAQESKLVFLQALHRGVLRPARPRFPRPKRKLAQKNSEKATTAGKKEGRLARPEPSQTTPAKGGVTKMKRVVRRRLHLHVRKKEAEKKPQRKTRPATKKEAQEELTTWERCRLPKNDVDTQDARMKTCRQMPTKKLRRIL